MIGYFLKRERKEILYIPGKLLMSGSNEDTEFYNIRSDPDSLSKIDSLSRKIDFNRLKNRGWETFRINIPYELIFDCFSIHSTLFFCYEYFYYIITSYIGKYWNSNA